MTMNLRSDNYLLRMKAGIKLLNDTTNLFAAIRICVFFFWNWASATIHPVSLNTRFGK
jgi:hypothetical protein